jgi:[protein-PII] uridylyltransferase
VTDAREIVTVESTLRTALQTERFDFAPLLADVRPETAGRAPELDFPTRITIGNESHPTCTLIQVETPDRLGLLYDLVACLGRNNVYITLSRISTDKGAAIDTFYVTDTTTRGKITEAKRIEQLQRQLHEAMLAPA